MELGIPAISQRIPKPTAEMLSAELDEFVERDYEAQNPEPQNKAAWISKRRREHMEEVNLHPKAFEDPKLMKQLAGCFACAGVS